MYTPGFQQAPQLQTMPDAELTAQPKPKAPAKAKAPGGDVSSFVQQLIGLAAYTKSLETQAHLIHLNYEGSNFLAIHGFMKDQYNAHLEQFDTLGEFVRSMDYLMPMSNLMLHDSGPPFNELTSYKANEMLSIYYKNLEELANKAKKLEPIAQKISAVDIANYLADLVGRGFKAAWFVKASLRST